MASHAGTKKKEVECDLLAKLGETIPGMKSTRSKKTKNAKKTQSINGDAFDVFRDIPNVLDGNLKKKKPKQKFAEDSKTEPVGEELLGFVSAMNYDTKERFDLRYDDF